MKRVLNEVLFIDDDEATNFIHEIIVRNIFPEVTIVVKKNGREGIEYLRAKEEAKQKGPDLILLDINMPVMNGWEFLQTYRDFSSSLKNNIVAFMISTSLNPDDLQRAQLNQDINSFIKKPLTAEALKSVCTDHFMLPVQQ